MDQNVFSDTVGGEGGKFDKTGDYRGTIDSDNNNLDPASAECKVYRVRSFTTKKGGSLVNRGDSIKVGACLMNVVLKYQ